MMVASQNGWPVLMNDSPLLYTWMIPCKSGAVTLRMRNGSAGFLLAHWVMWYDRNIEPVYQKLLDDWGYDDRNVRGSSDISNHASATAIDLNAIKHPLGRVGTLLFQVKSGIALARIKRRLATKYRGTIRSGACYSGRKDEMHYEIVRSLSACELLAKSLMNTSNGKLILATNPTQRAVILSR